MGVRDSWIKERGPPWVIRAGCTRGSSWKSWWWWCSCTVIARRLLLALALHLLPRSSLQTPPTRNYQSTVTRTDRECESTPLCRNIESAKHVTSHETSPILDPGRENLGFLCWVSSWIYQQVPVERLTPALSGEALSSMQRKSDENLTRVYNDG